MRVINFCGINFFDVKSFDNFIFFKNKTVFLFPSGPGLSQLENDKVYLSALKNGSVNFFDSGLLVLLLKLKNIHVKKFSGYLFINELFMLFKKNKINNYLFVEPSYEDSILNLNYMKNNNNVSTISSYIAPIYNYSNPEDYKLLSYINENKPSFIVINIGGGIQEKLAKWLEQNIKFQVKIVCTGAAISFLTKKQAPINNIIDKLFLGWFWRCLFNPLIFIPRYFKSLKLVYVFFKNYNSISIKEIVSLEINK